MCDKQSLFTRLIGAASDLPRGKIMSKRSKCDRPSRPNCEYTAHLPVRTEMNVGKFGTF